MHRRSFLTRGALGVGALATQACARATSVAPGIDAPVDVHQMADAIVRAADEDVADLALSWVDQGASHRDLLAASYLAGTHEVNPKPIGGQVHAMMMVPSADETAGVLRGRRKLLPALFNLERVKRSQRRDEGSAPGDWRLADPPPAEDRPVAELIAQLDAAMEAWDEDGADQAVTSLHGALTMHDFFEAIWPVAVRDYRIIGHKAIFAAQTYRALSNLGWRSGLPGVRSLARGVLDQNPYEAFSGDDTERILGVHQRNLERQAEIPADWWVAKKDPRESIRLLERLRDADIDQSATAVIQTLKGGVDAGTAWDGIRLYAFELMMWKPGIAAVHTVTSLNALWRTSLYTERESTRRIAVLQAASWMPLFRELLAKQDNQTYDIKIDTMRRSKDADPFTLTDPTEAAPRAAAMVADDGPASFQRRAYDVLSRKADHDHDYKFTVAAIEEVASAHSEIRPYLAAASMFFMRGEQDQDNHAFQRLK